MHDRILTRRDFLVASAAVGAGALLAGCTKQAPGRATSAAMPLPRLDRPVTWPIYADNRAIESGLPAETGPLKVFQWHEYLYKAVVDDFSSKYGVDVEVTSFSTMGEAIAKIRRTGADFDVFYPQIEVLPNLVAGRLLRPLNHDYLPNAANLWTQFRSEDKPFYDRGQRYTVPYTAYTSGIAWRNDLVDEKDWPSNRSNPYDVFWDPKFAGQIGIYDNYREAIALALVHRGISDVNTASQADIDAATDDLIEAAKTTHLRLTADGAEEGLPKGAYLIHQSWSGDFISAPFYGKGNYGHTAPLLSYWWPTDGTGVTGIDLTAILSQGRNPVLAHRFVNFLLEPSVALENFSWNGYQPPITFAGLERSALWSRIPPNAPNAIVSPEDFENGRMLLGLSPEADAMWRNAWDRFRSYAVTD